MKLKMEKTEMKALIINCSPVRDGATAEIVKLVSEQLSASASASMIIHLPSAKAAVHVTAQRSVLWKIQVL